MSISGNGAGDCFGKTDRDLGPLAFSETIGTLKVHYASFGRDLVLLRAGWKPSKQKTPGPLRSRLLNGWRTGLEAKTFGL